MHYSAHNIIPIIMSMGIFRCPRAANSTDHGLIMPNFKPIQDFLAVLVTCKNEDNQIKNEGARVLTTLYIDFYRCKWAANSVVGDGIWQKFKLIQACKVVQKVSCKNDEDPLKNECTIVLISPIIVI